MSGICLYREGDGWDGVELKEFSEDCVAETIGFVRDDAEGAEDLTVEHVIDTGMTVITYFNSDGESRNWIFPTALYCGNC
jgi:hypothetical protein